jgi:hypothetical protein
MASLCPERVDRIWMSIRGRIQNPLYAGIHQWNVHGQQWNVFGGDRIGHIAVGTGPERT